MSEMPARMMVRLTAADADWWTALAAMPRGQRSQAVRDALRLVLTGPTVLRELAAGVRAVARASGEAPAPPLEPPADAQRGAIEDLFRQFGTDPP